MSGWIKIHRAITDHWLYTEKRVFSRFEAWNDILLMVNYTDAKTIIKGKVYDIKRGQSILSLDSWAKRWNWDKSKVRRFMMLLQSEKMIELKSDTITTHLIVCKYESYQGERNADETRMKRKRNADETQTTPIEEEEERKEEKESNIATFETTLSEFKKMRNKMKAPLTDYAEKLLMSELEKLAPNDLDLQIKILEQSISKSWRGVFALKGDTEGNDKGYPSHLNKPKAGCEWRMVGNSWTQVTVSQPEL